MIMRIGRHQKWRSCVSGVRIGEPWPVWRTASPKLLPLIQGAGPVHRFPIQLEHAAIVLRNHRQLPRNNVPEPRVTVYSHRGIGVEFHALHDTGIAGRCTEKPEVEPAAQWRSPDSPSEWQVKLT